MILDPWSDLPPDKVVIITDTAKVRLIMALLGLSREFSHYEAMTAPIQVHLHYENHPTHWVALSYAHGCDDPSENGLQFAAYPKVGMSKLEFERTTRQIALETGLKLPEGNFWNRLPERPELRG